MTPIEVQHIVDFVEGRLEPKEFEQILYENPRFEEVLNAPDDPPNAHDGLELYFYAIGQNFNSPGDVLNLQVALAQFLERSNIPVQPTDKYHKFYRIILSAQPKWLDVDSAYVQREIMPEASDLNDKELKQWLRAEFLKRFIYLTKPPRWIQSPKWPIGKDGPLVFLGQIQVKDYFHDEAAVYVFHDPQTDIYETIRQTY